MVYSIISAVSVSTYLIGILVVKVLPSITVVLIISV